MAIKLPLGMIKALYKIQCEWSKNVDPTLSRIIRSGRMGAFKIFFETYIGNGRYLEGSLKDHEAILEPLWMSRFERPHLRWIYRQLLVEDKHLQYTAKIVMDRRIAADRRALCFHAVFDTKTRVMLSPEGAVLPQFWWYNRSAWNHYVFRIGKNSEDAFAGRLAIFIRREPRLSDAMRQGIGDDSVSVFEINRMLENRRISDSLMKLLIASNAIKCFTYILANYPETVFRLRSPQEWLLTVCRCAEEKFAVATVNELERQFPGIVAGTRDPWGNTLLWNTFFNYEQTKNLRSELIRLGCDPDAENELGLSYRLLIDNAPDETDKGYLTP